jgi:hypothetical protein
MTNGVFAITAIFSLAALSSCSKAPEYVASLDENVVWAENQALQMAPKGSFALAVCGSSAGKGLYLDKEQEWENADISDGRIVIVQLPDGKLDMIFRDASKTFYSALKDGGTINFTYNDKKSSQFGIVVEYPATGVIETHNFMLAPNGDRVDLWTTNKNISSIATIQMVSAYRAKCVK